MNTYPRWIVVKEFCLCNKEMELLGVEINEEGTAVLTHHKCASCGHTMSFHYDGKTAVKMFRKSMNENLGTQLTSYERSGVEAE